MKKHLLIFSVLFASILSLSAQDIQVSGKVIYADDSYPVIGATITVKGTTSGTFTDMDGNFQISIPQNSENPQLVISYAGFKTIESPIHANGQVVNVALEVDVLSINEVVVVGYGTQKKVNLTGAVSTLKPDEIQSRTTTNVLSAVQGLVPGVTITTTPGKDPEINFRGNGNLGSSSPLYIVDGVIVDAAFFSRLNPNTIENISFLKDAASSSIYGSRAAYGVVLVTTKKGKEGKLQVNYNGLVGTKMPTYKPNVIDSWQYAELRNEAEMNSGAGAYSVFSQDEINWLRDGSKPDLYPNSKWFDLAIDDHAVTTQHSANVSGATDRINFFAGIGYLYDTEYLRNRGTNRYNMDLNVSGKVTDWLKLHSSVKYTYTNYEVAGGTPDFQEMLIIPGTQVNKHSNGNWGTVRAGNEIGLLNPVYMYDTRDWNVSTRGQGIYEGGFDITPIEGLLIAGQAALNNYDYKGKSFVATRDPIESFLNPGVNAYAGNDLNQMNMSWSSSIWETYNARVSYNIEKDIHNFTVLAGTSYEKYASQNLSANRGNFPTDDMTDITGGAASGDYYHNGGGSSEYALLSYFGRLNYTLLGRYMFEANFRADASSRFYKDARWGYFPSFSAGWVISEEKFMDATSGYLDLLKLRGSYGTLGNMNNVGNYDYFANYATTGYYPWNGVIGNAISEAKPANRTLTWETVAMLNIGVDFAFWKGKLAGAIEYYDKNTSGILLGFPVMPEVGTSESPSQNIGKVNNKGIEIELNHRNKLGDWGYGVGGNLAFNKNKVVDLASSDDIISDAGNHGIAKTIHRVGESIGSYYGLKSDGLYSQEEIDAGRYYTYGGTTPQAGDIKFLPQRDIQYGEAITADDRTIIGSRVPKITYGINFNVSWKNIEFSAFGQGTYGSQVAFEVYQLHPFFHGADNAREYHLGRWTAENPNSNAIYPRIYNANDAHTKYNQTFNSDYGLFNANYFRIKTMTLAYTLPQKLLPKTGLSNIRVYVTGENLITFRGDKKMKDFDPEAASGTVLALGVKSVAFGVNLSF
ncbi:MAG: SusC/RagA family TonB-linked outer membrane protein [Bacteroidales bacterium]